MISLRILFLEGGPFSYLFLVLAQPLLLLVVVTLALRRGLPSLLVAALVVVLQVVGVFGTWWALGLGLDVVERAASDHAPRMAANTLAVAAYTLLESLWLGAVLIGLAVLADGADRRGEHAPATERDRVALAVVGTTVALSIVAGWSAFFVAATLGLGIAWRTRIVATEETTRATEASRRVGQGLLGGVAMALLLGFSLTWRFSLHHQAVANASAAAVDARVAAAWAWSVPEALALLVMGGVYVGYAVGSRAGGTRPWAVWTIPAVVPIVLLLTGTLVGRVTTLLGHVG